MTGISVSPAAKAAALRYIEQFSTDQQMPEWMIEHFKQEGWTIDKYCMKKRHKGYFLYIEFCIGDYCAYIGSRNGGWVLEDKKRCKTFIEAIFHIQNLEKRIDNGEHWTGEED